MLKIKRIYEKSTPDDGIRVLVDRLWPRGISRNEVNVDHWMKEIAPCDSLRKWFAHRTERWEEFKSRYLKELEDKKDLVRKLEEIMQKNTVTILYSAKDEYRNNAIVLFELIMKGRGYT